MINKQPLQSEINVRYDLIPPEVLEKVAQTLHYGAVKYGEKNWENISINDHINHALAHINSFRIDSTHNDEDDLIHAICRLMFARYLDEYPN